MTSVKAPSPARVKKAICESVALGTLTEEAISLVSALCRVRVVSTKLVDDIAQDVLLRLLMALPRIDPSRDVFRYVCSAISKRWKWWMRGRRVERRYLYRAAVDLLAELPVSIRGTASRQAFGSASRTFALKYY